MKECRDDLIGQIRALVSAVIYLTPLDKISYRKSRGQEAVAPKQKKKGD